MRADDHSRDREFSGHDRIAGNNPALIAISLVIALSVMVAPACAAADAQEISYLYTLSNFNGPILSHWANIYVDKERKDIYVVDPRERDVRIFDENGMQVFLFGDDGRFGTISDLTVDGEGNIIILSRKRSGQEIIVANYRGEVMSEIRLNGLPPEYAEFRPERVIYHDGHLYMIEASDLRVAVIDTDGTFKKGYDIAALVEIPDKMRSQNEMTGFSIDADGNMLFTISVLFQAYRLAPDGGIEAFGRSGGGPGTFGVVAGIVADESGYIYVTDRLRCVVMVFDKNLEFLTEFGRRGENPANLIVPNDIDMDGDGKLYVAQARERGVSVFAVSHR